jgi:hypothetical protein
VAVVKRNTPVHRTDGADLAAWKRATERMRTPWVEARGKAGDDGAALLKTADQLIVKYDQ